jgi:hypothetical protein
VGPSIATRKGDRVLFPDKEISLTMTSFCTIEYGSTERERRCGRAALTECVDCGVSICSSCCRECCGKLLCGYCYDFHVIHTCLSNSTQSELYSVPMAFHPAPHQETLVATP